MGQTISYKYNDSGYRTEKTVNGVTTKYYLNSDKVILEDNGNDSIYYSYDADDKLVSMTLNGTEYFYVRNGQGDITRLIDTSSTQVVSYTYDSWGKLISIDGSLKDTLGLKNPYRYRGYRYDTETGLYYLQSRYYNPEMGRYINADDVEFLGVSGTSLGYNLFAYCENNPVNNSDPTGYASWANAWWNSKWFISNALNTIFNAVILCITGGTLKAFTSMVKNAKQRYVRTIWDRALKRTFKIAIIGGTLGIALTRLSEVIITILLWYLDPGTQLFNILDSRELNRKTRNNGYLNELNF